MNNQTKEINRKAIVVLPFANMSNDPENEYFSDGITEEIINALTKIQGLKVIARTSAFAFKGKNMDVRKIGAQLEVTNVLEGSIRRIHNRVRITAQLINAEDGMHLWSRNFDRELADIFALQDEISLLIANQIRENFGHLDIDEHLVNKETDSISAYEYFLKGRFHQLQWDGDSLKKATRYYEKSVEQDPTYARSYYGAVQSYGLLAAWGYMPQTEGFEKAILNFLKARELDTSSAEYSMCYVGQSFWQMWDFQATFDQLNKILETHPFHGDSLEAMGELMLCHGKFAEAERYIKKALSVDPLSANHHYTLGNLAYYQKDFEKALFYAEQAMVYRTDFSLALILKANCLIWLNEEEKFLDFHAKNQRPELEKLLFQVINTQDYEPTPDILESWLSSDEDLSQLIPHELYILANTKYTGQAITLLKKYIDARRGQVLNYRQEPLLQRLHGIPEFEDLHQSNLQVPDNIDGDKKSTKKEVDNRLLSTQKEVLETFMEEERPYLNPQLSLTLLAESIDLHPNQLSYLINEFVGKNFNEYVNSYRLEVFKEKAVDPANQHLTLLGLAYESGFNSKTSFNVFFKKVIGKTPRAWVKSQASA